MLQLVLEQKDMMDLINLKIQKRVISAWCEVFILEN